MATKATVTPAKKARIISLSNSLSGRESVVLVHINFPIGNIQENLDEFKELALSAGANIVSIVTGARSVPDAKFFVGSGKANEIQEVIAATHAGLVIFNHNLTPAQERNLERLVHCRVLDRTGLILDIFAKRARSFEGKLQVELALLKHLSTRLVRGWTHLERQRGGIGLRGPGETQLEVDRRLIRNRIKIITAQLVKISKQRAQGRRARQRATVPTVALVGYTNAGKSTLFNHLTGASVYVADQLFATLDPTLRRIEFPEIGTVILADTVGFIRHLPPNLIKAFHATLEEVSEAQLLLHVVDANDEDKNNHIATVNQILTDINGDQVPCLIVYNKIDLSKELIPHINRDEQGLPRQVYISAAKALGMELLLSALAELLGKELIVCDVELTPEQAKLRAELYERGAVLAEKIDHQGHFHLKLRLPRLELEKIFR